MSNTKKFLLFLALTTCGQYFIMGSFKFVVYDITQSKSLVSVIGSIAAISFMVFGMFAGTIVDAISRKLFIYIQLIGALLLSIIVFALFQAGLKSVWIVFAFILIYTTWVPRAS